MKLVFQKVSKCLEVFVTRLVYSTGNVFLLNNATGCNAKHKRGQFFYTAFTVLERKVNNERSIILSIYMNVIKVYEYLTAILEEN